jgi:hypothetical protein
MGRMRGAYNAEFPVGTAVAIAPREVLVRFQRPRWSYHHPLTDEQLRFAGRTATVSAVGYYHGGDELYQLEAVPGTWHEGCLECAEGSSSDA